MHGLHVDFSERRGTNPTCLTLHATPALLRNPSLFRSSSLSASCRITPSEASMWLRSFATSAVRRGGSWISPTRSCFCSRLSTAAWIQSCTSCFRVRCAKPPFGPCRNSCICSTNPRRPTARPLSYGGRRCPTLPMRQCWARPEAAWDSIQRASASNPTTESPVHRSRCCRAHREMTQLHL